MHQDHFSLNICIYSHKYKKTLSFIKQIIRPDLTWIRPESNKNAEFYESSTDHTNPIGQSNQSAGGK